jgi:hypothetical protein
MDNLDAPPTWWAPYADEFPCWHAWTGVAGLLYVRRLKSSPPVVYRAADPAELEARIREHEGRQR